MRELYAKYKTKKASAVSVKPSPCKAKAKVTWEQILDTIFGETDTEDGVIDSEELLTEEINKIRRNHISGLRATGIFPLDRDEVFKRLPSASTRNYAAKVSEKLVNYLEEKRYPAQVVGFDENGQPKKKKTK